MNASFEKLLQRSGNYSLPYLIHLHDADNNISLHFVNDVKKITYMGTDYIPSTFSYTANAGVQGFNGGGKLTIEIDDVNNQNMVINLTDNYTSIYLDVIGVINEQNSITEIKTYKHHYGSVKISKTQAEFTFAEDDRLKMTFPALIWNRCNNRGNS